MINDITNGISTKLNSVFGDGYTVYSSNVEQGLEEPCFFIKLLKPISTHFLGKRKKIEYPFDVHYFPEDDSDNDGMYEVGERLSDELEYIDLLNGDIVRGKDISFEIIDRVLHFSVTYTVFMNDITKDESMGGYGLDVGVN
ncbi:MAG: DUF6838 family protein [Lachnospiraceae bacterium]